MKNNKYFNLEKRNLQILLILSLLFSVFFFNPLNQINSSYKKSYEDHQNELINPKISNTDFDNGSKIISTGFQIGIYNESNIEQDDDLVDSTKFYQDCEESKSRKDANYFYGGCSFWWGTNLDQGGIQENIEPALKNKDGINLWIRANYGLQYPSGTTGDGHVWMVWSGYSDIDSSFHDDINMIRIRYGLSVDYTYFTGLSKDLILWAFTNNTENTPCIIKNIHPNPGDREYVEGIWEIDWNNPYYGAFLQSINNGEYIQYMGLSLNMSNDNNLLNLFTWLNVDYIEILYGKYNYDIDFAYEFDFKSYNFGTITEFDIQIDIPNIISGLEVQLYNYEKNQTDNILIADTTELLSILIDENADDYFNDNDTICIRFALFDYDTKEASSSLILSIDQISINIHRPYPPTSIVLEQGIGKISLAWAEPDNNGVPITHYNIYRGENENGKKDLIASTPINEFIDTPITGLIYQTTYYYTITAVNIIGESENSTEVSGEAFPGPFVDWLSLKEGDTVILGVNNNETGKTTFNFTYDCKYIDHVELFLNNLGPFDVTNKNYINLTWSNEINGTVAASLYGYNESILVYEDTINLNFVKIMFETKRILQENITFVGNELYFILHDPNGDGSYTSFLEGSDISIGIGASITDGISLGTQLGVILDFDWLGLGGGATTGVTEKTTSEIGFDFRLDVSTMTMLTSSQEMSDSDYIGPGYGDVYWGEAWYFRHEITAIYREYSNGSNINEEPTLYWGLEGNSTAILGDHNAPAEWRQQNPVYNDWKDVSWLNNSFIYSGGGHYEEKYSVSNSLTSYKSHDIWISSDTHVVIPGLEEKIVIEFNTKHYSEQSISNYYEIGFELFDDDNSDILNQQLGIDMRFGTFIFKTNSFQTLTSNPLEHNTVDYIPPIIGFPVIEYDINNDGLSPGPDDNPYILVDIFDEGGISNANIYYSVDDGLHWDFVSLTEQLGNLGTWKTNLPAQPANTRVIWYIQAWDNQGRNSTKYDHDNNPFEYIVSTEDKNSVSSPDVISSYPNIILISILIISVISIVIIYHRKSVKFRK